MIRGSVSVEGLGLDFLVMVVVFAVFITVATRLYPNLIR
jgi:hypothetical protein